METPSGAISLCVQPQRGAYAAVDYGFDYADILATRFNVGIHFSPRGSATDTARFVRIVRTLGHFRQLEAATATSHGVQQTIDDYTAAVVASWSPFFSIERESHRLASQLETFLSKMLASETHSATVRSFFGYHEECSEREQQIIDQCIARDGQTVEEVGVLGGCSHAIELEMPDSATTSIVLWKWQFDGENVDMAVTSTVRADARSDDVDPYSEAALAWQEDTTSSSTEQRVLRFPTRLPTSNIQDKWAYDACMIPSSSDTDSHRVIRLEWTNADTADIFSKTLRVQACIATSSNTDPTDWKQLIDRHAHDAAAPHKLAWLERLVAASPLTEWPVEEDEDGAADISAADLTPTSERVEHSSSQLRQLENKVAMLENELESVKSELRTTKSELEISSEVYKASLETIAQLELAAAAASARSMQGSEVSFSEGEATDHDSEDEYDDGDARTLDEDASEETTRLRDLVATFQEQCLWRSIETTESEKRTLLLELEVNRLEHDAHKLTERLAAVQAESEAMQAENTKLKAQKSLLVKEVKRLMPFSHVNLAALVHEAEEARMMQRSLQTQLSELRAVDVNPETEHPPED